MKVRTPDNKWAEFPDGTSPAVIKKALASITGPYVPAARPSGALQGAPEGGSPPPPSGAPPAAPAPQQAPQQDMVQRLTGFLQPAGGMIGGLGGGLLGAEAGGIGAFPGAVAGAGLGGAAGAGLRDMILSATGHPTSQLGPLQGGATEAGMQAAGEGIGQAVKMGSKAAMMVAAKTADPAVAQTAIDEGIAVTKRGLSRLMQRIGASGDAAAQMAQDATTRGQKFNAVGIAKDVMSDLTPSISAQPATSQPNMAMARRLTMRFLAKGQDITPVALHEAKQAADNIAKPIYDAMDQGQVVGPRQQMVAQWNKAFADRARETLNLMVPDYAEQNARTAQLLKLKDTIWPEAGKTLGPLAQMVKAGTRPAIGAGLGAAVGAEANPGNRVQGAVMGGLAGGIAGNPGVMSSAALLGSNPYMQFLLKQTPRLFDNGSQP